MNRLLVFGNVLMHERLMAGEFIEVLLLNVL